MRHVFPSALLALTLAASEAAAQLTCGAVIHPGEKVKLTADLGPCDGPGPAITVDSATLDLGGFTVSCADLNSDASFPNGIGLTGTKARVSNGNVQGCKDGVFLEGAGKHIVKGLRVTGNHEDGIDLRSDCNKNRIVGNFASFNGDDGIEVPGDKNKVRGNSVNANGEDGIDINLTTIDGVDYIPEKNQIVGNTCEGNGDEGIVTTGNTNLIKSNRSVANGENGIEVFGEGNRVIGNTAMGHFPGPDIVGGEPCTANTFRNNKFSTASGDCVR